MPVRQILVCVNEPGHRHATPNKTQSEASRGIPFGYLLASTSLWVDLDLGAEVGARSTYTAFVGS
jgi:hypothetical protein